MCVVKHSRTQNLLPGAWSEFSGMEWPACFPACNRIFLSSFTLRVFLAGLEREARFSPGEPPSGL